MSHEQTVDDELSWFCLRTQTKREHIAASALSKTLGGDVEVFCPRIRFKKPTRRGVIWWVEPMFPGYLLARFRKLSSLTQVLHTNGVSGLVQFGEAIPTIPDAFVEHLQGEFSEGEEGVTTVEHKLGVGDEVEVLDGAFRGVGGVILEVRPSEERVHVLLEFLGESRPVEVDIFALMVRERAQ